MTTETVLTDERIFALGAEIDITSANPNVNVLMFSRGEFLATGRAFERAVLQSPEVQQMRKDAERYRWLRSLQDEGQDCVIEDMWEMALHGIELDAAIDAAMEKKP